MRYLRWGVIAVLVAVLPFLLCSNYFDWDVFLAYHEVDYRAWTLDRTLPLWSYQLCAGATRIGDPQAMSLSPLFAWVVAFGPWWGTKFLVYSCWLLGFVFTRKLLLLLIESSTTSVECSAPPESSKTAKTPIPIWVDLLALGFVSGNFFLWHLHVGHVTFALIGCSLGIVYYTCKAWLRGLQPKDWAWGTLLCFAYYSGGFYQATLYFLLPCLLSLGLVLVWQGVSGLVQKTPQNRDWRVFLHIVGFHVLGILLASYKLYFVLAYQRTYPRTIEHLREVGSVWQMVLSLFIPTWNHRYLGQWQPVQDHRYGIWEHSHFNLLIWLALVMLVWALYRSWKQGPSPQAGQGNVDPSPQAGRGTATQYTSMRMWIGRWVWLYGGVVVLFSLGDVVGWSPHSLLNWWVFHGSVRVIQRYQVGLPLVVMLGMALWLWRDERWQQRFMRWLAWPLLLGIFLNLWTFSASLSVEQFWFLQRSQPSRHVRMQWMVLVPHQQGELPPMQQAVRAGLGVINCYTPLWIDHRPFIRELPHTKRGIVYDGNTSVSQPKLVPLSLVDNQGAPVPSSCVKGSYFTQSRVVLDASCPRRVCVQIRQNNLYRPAQFRWDQRVGKYCRD